MFSFLTSFKLPTFANFKARKGLAALRPPQDRVKIDRRLRKAVLRLIKKESTRPQPMARLETVVFYSDNDKAYAYLASPSFEALIHDLKTAGWAADIRFHPTMHGLYTEQAGQFAIMLQPEV